MTIFYLDTSALVKRYKTEEGSDMIDNLYDNLPRGHSMATSFLTVLEFVSAIRRLFE
jgi:predicted nucleic acid-binding protein